MATPSFYQTNLVYPHRVTLFATRFRYAGRRMLYGRARLFGDRIELSSWRRGRRRVEVVPLADVAEVDYHPLAHGSNLRITLADGLAHELYLDQAHQWRAYFENWLRYDVLPSAKLRGGPEAALAYSG